MEENLNDNESDSDILPDIFEKCCKQVPLSKMRVGDIVWSQYNGGLYWPALIRNVHKKKRKFRVWYLDAPAINFTVDFRNVHDFGDAEFTKEVTYYAMQSPDKDKHAMVVKLAQMYLFRRAKATIDDPAKFFDNGNFYLSSFFVTKDNETIDQQEVSRNSHNSSEDTVHSCPIADDQNNSLATASNLSFKTIVVQENSDKLMCNSSVSINMTPIALSNINSANLFSNISIKNLSSISSNCTLDSTLNTIDPKDAITKHDSSKQEQMNESLNVQYHESDPSLSEEKASKIVACIKSGHINEHLARIHSKEIFSIRQDIYEKAVVSKKSGILYENASSVNIKDPDKQNEIIYYLMNLYEKMYNSSNFEFFIYNVWFPEALDRAIEIINGDPDISFSDSSIPCKLPEKYNIKKKMFVTKEEYLKQNLNQCVKKPVSTSVLKFSKISQSKTKKKPNKYKKKSQLVPVKSP